MGTQQSKQENVSQLTVEQQQQLELYKRMKLQQRRQKLIQEKVTQYRTNQQNNTQTNYQNFIQNTNNVVPRIQNSYKQTFTQPINKSYHHPSQYQQNIQNKYTNNSINPFQQTNIQYHTYQKSFKGNKQYNQNIGTSWDRIQVQQQLYPKNEYTPRLKHPTIHNKVSNSFIENKYQTLYQERRMENPNKQHLQQPTFQQQEFHKQREQSSQNQLPNQTHPQQQQNHQDRLRQQYSTHPQNNNLNSQTVQHVKRNNNLQQIDKNKIRTHFINKQEKEENNFKQQQKQRRELFEMELTNFNELFNPRHVLNLPKEFTLNDLKKSYRKAALAAHPDRGGDAQLFKMITKAYMSLVEEYKRGRPTEKFNELRQNASTFMKTQGNNNEDINKNRLIGTSKGTKVRVGSGNDFDKNAFNKLYNENRIGNAYDKGYGNWSKHNALEEKDIPKVFSDKFNLNVFNSMFSKVKQTQSQQNQVIKYTDPQAMQISQDVGYTVLGQNKIKDFSNRYNINSNNSKLFYTDYRKAHTETTLIDPTSVKKRKNFTSVDDIRVQRANTNFSKTTKEKQKIKEQILYEKQKELERQRRLLKRDKIIEQQHKKINRMLISQ